MPQYKLTKPFQPCLVTKKLVKRLEDTIQQYANDLDGEEYKRSNFDIVIRDSAGNEKINSIDDYRHDSFSIDTKEITLNYSPSYDSETRPSIKVTFSESGPESAFSGSHIEFSLTSDTAKEIAKGRSEEIANTINLHNNFHFFNSFQIPPKIEAIL